MSRNKTLRIASWNTYWNIYVIVICTGALWKSTLATNSLLPLKTGVRGTGVKGFIVPGDQNSGCDYDCHDAERQLFCGSNGHTFDSECRANKSLCEDPHLTVTPGECDNSNRCIMERDYYYKKVQSSSDHMQPVNIPTCTKSGEYAPTQCSMIMEYCWCVTPLGKMIKNSTFTIESNGICGKRKSRSKSKKRCENYVQKAVFALKLRELIVNENRRGLPMSNSAVVASKHNKKERDGDGHLNAKEMKSLLRSHKKKLPRTCNKFFLKFCDIDEDKKISIDEFCICLGVRPFRRKRVIRVTKPVLVLREKNRHIIESRPTLAEESMRKPGTAPKEKRVCYKVRRELIRAQMKKVIIPSCEGPNGTYWSPVQCYKDEDIEYCYCAVRETGFPIPQTSENGKPNCKLAKLSPDVSVPIPGCPPKDKSKLLRGAQAFILKTAQEAGALTARGNSTLTDKVLAAQWYFDVVDKNGDEYLMRKEIKNFKKVLQKQKLPKKCLRKFSQHCDRNKDKKISKEEFVACLEVRRQQHSRSREMGVTITKLRTTEDTDNK